MRSGIEAFLIDLDGVLYVGKSPIPGAKECLNFMQDRGYIYRFVSNSTRRCRDSVAGRLNGLGYDVPAEYIFTPPMAAIDHMKRLRRRDASCSLPEMCIWILRTPELRLQKKMLISWS